MIKIIRNFIPLCVGSFLVLCCHVSYAQVAVDSYSERTDLLELEVRRLTGEIETLRYQNKNLEIQLNGLRKEFNLRLEELEKSQDTTDQKKNNEEDDSEDKDPVSKIISPAIEKNKGTARVLYDAAWADLQRKKYSEAAEGFQRIIDDYPDDDLSSNAYYWLGETYYARKDYSRAALTFLEGKKKFPKSNKAGHNLLKLGLSLHYLNQNQDACFTFDEVEKHYLPKDKSLNESLQRSRKKANCKAS